MGGPASRAHLLAWPLPHTSQYAASRDRRRRRHGGGKARRLWARGAAVAALLARLARRVGRAAAARFGEQPRLPPLDPSETGPRNSSGDIQRHSAPQADRLPDLLPDMNGRALAEFSAALAAAELWLPVALEQISDEAAEKLSFLRVADSLVLLAAFAQLRCGIS